MGQWSVAWVFNTIAFAGVFVFSIMWLRQFPNLVGISCAGNSPRQTVFRRYSRDFRSELLFSLISTFRSPIRAILLKDFIVSRISRIKLA